MANTSKEKKFKKAVKTTAGLAATGYGVRLYAVGKRAKVKSQATTLRKDASWAYKKVGGPTASRVTGQHIKAHQHAYIYGGAAAVGAGALGYYGYNKYKTKHEPNKAPQDKGSWADFKTGYRETNPKSATYKRKLRSGKTITVRKGRK